MLAVVVLLIIAVVVYSSLQEGLLTAVTMAVNVMFGGIMAFGFFEPVATELGSWLNGTILEGYEDAIALGGIFCAVFGALKLAANNVAPEEMELPPLFQQIATGAVAAVAGFFLAGFLLCMIETMPLGDKVLGHDPLENVEGPTTLASYFPPDRLWLAMMNRMGNDNLSWGEGSVTFDPDGTFQLRYGRLRRYKLPSAP